MVNSEITKKIKVLFSKIQLKLRSQFSLERVNTWIDTLILHSGSSCAMRISNVRPL